MKSSLKNLPKSNSEFITRTQFDDAMESLLTQIKELSRSRSKERTHPEKSYNRNNSENRRSRSKSRRRFDPKSDSCWYHQIYEENAKHCIPPCKFSKCDPTSKN